MVLKIKLNVLIIYPNFYNIKINQKFKKFNLNFSKIFLFYLNKKINIFLIFFNYLYKKEMGNCYAVNSTTEVSTEAPKYIYEDA